MAFVCGIIFLCGIVGLVMYANYFDCDPLTSQVIAKLILATLTCLVNKWLYLIRLLIKQIKYFHFTSWMCLGIIRDFQGSSLPAS